MPVAGTVVVGGQVLAFETQIKGSSCQAVGVCEVGASVFKCVGARALTDQRQLFSNMEQEKGR